MIHHCTLLKLRESADITSAEKVVVLLSLKSRSLLSRRLPSFIFIHSPIHLKLNMVPYLTNFNSKTRFCGGLTLWRLTLVCKVPWILISIPFPCQHVHCTSWPVSSKFFPPLLFSYHLCSYPIVFLFFYRHECMEQVCIDHCNNHISVETSTALTWISRTSHASWLEQTGKRRRTRHKSWNSAVQSNQLSWTGKYKKCVQWDLMFTSLYVVQWSKLNIGFPMQRFTEGTNSCKD